MCTYVTPVKHSILICMLILYINTLSERELTTVSRAGVRTMVGSHRSAVKDTVTIYSQNSRGLPCCKLEELLATMKEENIFAWRETCENGEIRCRFHRWHVKGEDTWIDIAKIKGSMDRLGLRTFSHR